MLIALLVSVLAAPPEIAPQPHTPLPPGIDPALADWTPRPATGKAEPWEKATDKDWIDPRFRTMNTGPALNCTMKYPLGKEQSMVYKATVVKLGEKGDAGVVFDRSTMRLTAAWTGGYLNHSDRRFGLLNTPTPKGEMRYAVGAGPGWADPDGNWGADTKRFTAPLPEKWARYRGHYLHGDRVIFKYDVGSTPVLESYGAGPTEPSNITRQLWVTPGKNTLRTSVAVFRGEMEFSGDGEVQQKFGIHWVFSPSDKPQSWQATYGLKPNAAKEAAIDISTLTKGGPKRWGEPIVTKLIRGEESGAFAIDTLTIPYKNPHGALFFCTGLDFLPDGRIAMCTCHGDVWLVTVDEKAGTCSWQRFATGLYHALGLKVVDGKVVVIERGQLTRLHDLNNDGEADFYECISNAWDTGSGEHSYDTCLETDPQGNFYFFKTGDTDTPSGGSLIRVSKDGSKSEIFSTGFRHPIGMGMSPTGILTGADQEGNWMPATRIDEYKQGGFYGDMRAHHRKEPPKTYDPPLCWLPREVDNSAGGQTWVPEKTFGPLAGLPLHFSYGRCKPFVLLRQVCDNGVSQGGAVDLGLKFLSGVCRGRFGPDGNLYVCGLNGWQTSAQADGCLQRVRYTGKPLDVPVKMAVEGNTIRLTFSNPLDAKSVEKSDNSKAAWWNYRWSGEYGSRRWKVSDPNAEGQDEFAPQSVKLLDAQTVELRFEKLQPVMQMQVGYNLLTTENRKVVGSVFLTINTTGK
ncbi:MAG: hypothetical protein K8U57_27195 [Planctomycetes bacterium]|nr:hypothetical protein [Planctomycetota bacterium]